MRICKSHSNALLFPWGRPCPDRTCVELVVGLFTFGKVENHSSVIFWCLELYLLWMTSFWKWTLTSLVNSAQETTEQNSADKFVAFGHLWEPCRLSAGCCWGWGWMVWNLRECLWQGSILLSFPLSLLFIFPSSVNFEGLSALFVLVYVTPWGIFQMNMFSLCDTQWLFLNISSVIPLDAGTRLSPLFQEDPLDLEWFSMSSLILGSGMLLRVPVSCFNDSICDSLPWLAALFCKSPLILIKMPVTQLLTSSLSQGNTHTLSIYFLLFRKEQLSISFLSLFSRQSLCRPD